MIRTELRLASSELTAVLLPRLIRRVFHVTCAANVAAIDAAGHIDINTDGQYETAFGSSANSFFRNRGCVSLFDYRTATSEELEDSLLKCSPFQAARRCGWHIAFFFLREDALTHLRFWRESKESESWAEMVVPYVEAGHAGSVPLSSIDELLELTIDDKPSALELAIEARRSTDGSP